MVSRKLFESDKKKILELYRLPGETTSTLAGRYGVSNSTISRILKTNLDEAEYESLIQQKRGRSQVGSLPETADDGGSQQPIASDENNAQLEIQLPIKPKSAPPVRRSRRRSSAPNELTDPPDSNSPSEALPLSDLSPSEKPQIVELVQPSVVNNLNLAYKVEADAEATALEQILEEDFLNQEEDLTGLDEDDDEDEDDDDDEDDEDLEKGVLLVGSTIAGRTLVQVLPFKEASLPKTCYLVVDRSAELIVRPLQEFGDLGQIPEAEILEKTLPVFDNHRVAKRYSNPRTQRVIKLPDGRVLQKTSSHLQAKGITRLLIDGQVYALQ